MGNTNRIVWRDHFGDADGGSWWTQAEIAKYINKDWRITTTGEVIYEDDTWVVLAPEAEPRAQELQYRKWTAIAKALILERTRLQ